MNQGHEHGRGGGRGRGGGGRGGHDASVDKAHRMMGGGGGKLDGVIDVMYQDYLHGGKLLTSFSQWCDHNQHKENQPVASIMRLVFACFKGQLPPPARTATIHKIKQQFDKGQKIRQLQVPPNIVGHLAGECARVVGATHAT